MTIFKNSLTVTIILLALPVTLVTIVYRVGVLVAEDFSEWMSE